MAGRCSCSGSGGCGCCFTSSGGTVTLAGTGTAGACITPSIRFSGNAGNAATVGSDGGLFVPSAGGGGGGGGAVALRSAQGLVGDDVEVSESLVDGIAGSVAMANQTISVINPSATAVAKALLVVHQRFELVADAAASGSMIAGLTLTASGAIDPSGTLSDGPVLTLEVHPRVGGSDVQIPATASLAIPVLAAGTVSVEVATAATATVVDGGGSAIVFARTFSLIIVGG